MALATVLCRALSGMDAPLVTVEVHIAGGLPSMSIVGLPETAVRESKDRVKAALQNAGFEVPPSRITVSLAPADLPKEGGRYDLPIALGILAATRQVSSKRLAGHVFIGELGLSGELRPVRGTLSAALATGNDKQALVVPQLNAPEAALIADCKVLPAADLSSVCQYLNQGQGLGQAKPPQMAAEVQYPDLEDIKGQHHARRALEVAAAGGHNLLLFGPPGTGKSMLAQRLPGILPPLTQPEALSSAAIASVSGSGFDLSQWRRRIFRAPHHTTSAAAMIGGGSTPKPGEVSLSHLGILHLDELAEFKRSVLEVLREPLESGQVTISRAAGSATYPADFQLVAAMNPCPCGYSGSRSNRCRCSADQIRRYQSRLSGPLLDRIDLHVEVPEIPAYELQRLEPGEASAVVKERVIQSRRIAIQRQNCLNTQMDQSLVQAHCLLGNRENRFLEQTTHRLGLSARAYYRILKVARTIADLQASPRISLPHLSEAIQYRQLDRQPDSSL